MLMLVGLQRKSSGVDCHVALIVIGSHCCNWLCDIPFQTLEPLAFDLPITCIRHWSPRCILSPQVKYLNHRGNLLRTSIMSQPPYLTNQWHRLTVDEICIPSRGMCLSAINEWMVAQRMISLCFSAQLGLRVFVLVHKGQYRWRQD